jgi:hypothetical protein
MENYSNYSFLSNYDIYILIKSVCLVINTVLLIY